MTSRRPRSVQSVVGAVASQGNSTQDQAALREQSLPELVKQLAEETSTLVRKELELARSEAQRAGETVVALARQELQLAKAEMAEKGRKAVPGIGMVGQPEPSGSWQQEH